MPVNDNDIFHEIIVTAALAKHAYSNDLDPAALAEDAQEDTWDMVPIALLKERCWLFFDSRAPAPKLYICFRGTDSFHDALIDCDFRRAKHPMGEVHRGFWAYYEEIRSELLHIVTYFLEAQKHSHCHIDDENECNRLTVVLTGHSLGAASAMLAATDLLSFTKNIICTTFGMPPLGDERFCDNFNKSIHHSYRVVVDSDFAPRIAFPGLCHVKNEILLKSCTSNNKNKNKEKPQWDPIYHHSMNFYVKTLHALQPPPPVHQNSPKSQVKRTLPPRAATTTLTLAPAALPHRPRRLLLPRLRTSIIATAARSPHGRGRQQHPTPRLA